MSRTNFVLIDFENVQPKDIQLLIGGPYKIMVFLGAKQTKVPVELVLALQPFGLDAEYIQIEGNGNNALDFHIAYYIGRLAGPAAFFHIISKDTGFDPLIKHLKEKEIFCLRSITIADIPLLKSVKSTETKNVTTATIKPVIQKAAKPTETTKVNSVIEKLSSQKASKPRTLKTLGSTIKAHFSDRLADEDLHHLINILVQQNIIKVSDGKVTYTLPY